TAEDIKIAIGSAYPLDEEVTTFFRGRDLLTGLPRSIEVTSAQIREALDPSVEQIVDAIKDTIEETPPELIADVMDQGIYRAGGALRVPGTPFFGPSPSSLWSPSPCSFSVTPPSCGPARPL